MKNWKNILEDTREKYKLYMCSREWKVKARDIRERSGGTCERCDKNKSNQVHHLTYERLYDEKLEDLQDLCDDCHKFVSAKSDYDPSTKIDKKLNTNKKEKIMSGKLKNKGSHYDLYEWFTNTEEGKKFKNHVATNKSRKDFVFLPYWLTNGPIINDRTPKQNQHSVYKVLRKRFGITFGKVKAMPPQIQQAEDRPLIKVRDLTESQFKIALESGAIKLI